MRQFSSNTYGQDAKAAWDASYRLGDGNKVNGAPKNLSKTQQRGLASISSGVFNRLARQVAPMGKRRGEAALKSALSAIGMGRNAGLSARAATAAALGSNS